MKPTSHILPASIVMTATTFGAFVTKETRHIVRDRRTLLILFGLPTVMMLLFGFAIRNDVRDIRTVIVTSVMNHTAQRIISALDASPYFTITGTAPSGSEAERLIRHQKADLAIVFSSRLTQPQSTLPRIQILTDAADPNMAQQYANYASGIISQTLAAAAHRGYAPSLPAMAGIRMLYNPRMLSAYNFVPGIMGMLLMLICTMMTSVSIAREKERGTMEVLLVSPVRPLVIIIAKAVPYMLLSVIILTVILLMSRYVLDVPLAGAVGTIFMISLLYILLALSLGLLVSNKANSQLTALLISAMVLLMPVIMLSGLIFPIESMPDVLQWVSCIVPARWYISATRKLMIMGVGIHQIRLEISVLSAMTLLILSLALRTFKTRLQ